MKQLVIGVLLGFMGMASAHAVPTRDEVYRSERLSTVVYKDSQDANVFWYLPPIKLYEVDGKVVTYRRVKGDKTNYYFYIQPFMNDELIDLLAGEIPGLQNKTQLKPVIARQFGIQVKQFNAAAMGDKITDFHYLNQPQLISFSLDASAAEDFDFFVANKPGIQANVLFDYESERMDKYLNIELTYKEVYDALNIGVTGKYKFTKAEISATISDLVAKKYLTIKSKGDIPIPDIVNKAIEECFTPYKKTTLTDSQKKTYKDWDNWLATELPQTPEVLDAVSKQVDTLELLAGGAWDPSTDDAPWGTNPPKGSSGASGTSGSSGSSGSRGGGNSGGWPGGGGSSNGDNSDMSIQFTFKKELANVDKSFYYNQSHFVDASEVAAIPVYLSTAPAAVKAKVKVTPLAKRDFVVEYTNEQTKPFSSGITVGEDEQYIINAVFAFSARSAYDSALKWYRWSGKTWPSVDDELYYRVGTGQWNKVNGRTVIKTETIYRGALEFYLDRKHIWEKVPADFKNPKLLGIVPAIFSYKYTYPQFNVVITGRKVEVNP